MAILSDVSLPLTADNLKELLKNYHENYSYDRILFETVVPIPGKNDLYRLIAVYDDSNPVEPTSISEEVVINDDTKGE